ncbi:MAG TPA: GNAT family N-acetyltransferase [Trebonia sp.]|nr:GNAT family N-acetyltransferase [Trebonia sp.]
MSMPVQDGREPSPEPGSLLGGLFDVRRARRRDRQPLALMLDRCGSETRYRRFHGHVSAFPERYLAEALSGSPAHFALVAEAAGGGTLVALASCRTVTAGIAEIGILVEDAWQRLGIGGRLLAEIINHAERTRLTTLRAQLLADQAWITGMLRRHGTCAAVASRDVLDVTLRLGC